jgi:hypothetical protein
MHDPKPFGADADACVHGGDDVARARQRLAWHMPVVMNLNGDRRVIDGFIGEREACADRERKHQQREHSGHEHASARWQRQDRRRIADGSLDYGFGMKSNGEEGRARDPRAPC